MKKKLKSVITSLSMLQLKKWHKLRHKISTKGGSEMKIYTLGDILKTEHLGDEKYVRVEEIERLKRDGRCIAEAKEIYHKGMIDAKIEIEQLKKEKKWLIKACTEFMYGTIEVTSWKDAKDKVLEEMQQELEEE